MEHNSVGYRIVFEPNTLKHYGVLGMRWGVRNSRRTGGPGTAYESRMLRKDNKWADKKGAKVYKKNKKSVSKEMKNFVKKEWNPEFSKNKKLSSKSILSYNNKLANLLNSKVNDSKLRSPSGKVLRFVAKRGEIGVFTAYGDAGYDMKRIKNGVFTSGKVGYLDENLMEKRN